MYPHKSPLTKLRVQTQSMGHGTNKSDELKCSVVLKGFSIRAFWLLLLICRFFTVEVTGLNNFIEQNDTTLAPLIITSVHITFFLNL